MTAPIPSHRQKRLKILYTSGWESARADLGKRPDFFRGLRRKSAPGGSLPPGAPRFNEIFPGSAAQVGPLHVLILQEGVGGGGLDDVAGLQDIAPVGH